MLITKTPHKLIVDYDKEYDKITVHIKGEKIASYTHGVKEWLQLHKSLKDNEYTAITVWDFMKRYKSNQLKDLEIPIMIKWDYIAKKIKNKYYH